MPTISTLAPASFARRVIACRFARVDSIGRPRNASLAPSSITTSPGFFSRNSVGSRASPPAVVSPLMLALTTVASMCSRARRCSSSATQPLPRTRPYSAERLSPTTRIGRWPSAAEVGIATAKAAHAMATLQCATQRRRVDAAPENTPSFMSEPIIAVERLTKRVQDSTGTLTILHEIDFTLPRQRSVAIVGASGSGKSTLLSLIAGLDTPTTGTVRLDGIDLFAIGEDERAAVRAAKVGFVFQSFQLLANLNALENVMLPLELQGRAEARPLATEMLRRVGLGERLRHYPRVLSGGEQQRVALARAFVVRPAVLFADEPTGSLDFATGETVMALMFELNREAGTTLVLVTHDPALAGRCDQQLRIEAGRVSVAEAAST